jgi:hypothetical protein
MAQLWLALGTRNIFSTIYTSFVLYAQSINCLQQDSIVFGGHKTHPIAPFIRHATRSTGLLLLLSLN